MSNRNKMAVPAARKELDPLKAKVIKVTNPENAKYEVAKEQGISLNVGYNGDLLAKDAGKIGGAIGGKMVKELIKMAKSELNNK